MISTHEAIGTDLDIVSLPSHIYFHNNYPSPVVRSFNSFAAGMSDLLDGAKYPQARLIVEPHPVDMQNGSLSFYAVWGDKTDTPDLPQIGEREAYFGVSPRKAEKSKRMYERVQLDANGFVGRVRLRRGIGMLAIASSNASGQVFKTELGNVDDTTFESCAVDALAVAKAVGLTRFHASVRWWPRNGYAFCNTFDDDTSSKAVRVLS